MVNHVLEIHKQKLISDLPLRRKGLDLDYRLEFAIGIMKRIRPMKYYDHRTAKFAPD